MVKKLTLHFGGRYLYSITPMMVKEYKTKRANEDATKVSDRFLEKYKQKQDLYTKLYIRYRTKKFILFTIIAYICFAVISGGIGYFIGKRK